MREVSGAKDRDPEGEPPRVMLDANLSIGAFLRPGASRQVMEWAREGRVTLVLSPYVIAEARRMISRAFRHRLAEFDAWIAATPHELTPDPTPEEVATHRRLVEDPADVPVALGAIHAGVDYLLSSDRHLIADDSSTHALRQQVQTMNPSRFVREVMGGTRQSSTGDGDGPPSGAATSDDSRVRTSRQRSRKAPRP